MDRSGLRLRTFLVVIAVVAVLLGLGRSIRPDRTHGLYLYRVPAGHGFEGVSIDPGQIGVWNPRRLELGIRCEQSCDAQGEVQYTDYICIPIEYVSIPIALLMFPVLLLSRSKLGEHGGPSMAQRQRERPTFRAILARGLAWLASRMPSVRVAICLFVILVAIALCLRLAMVLVRPQKPHVTLRVFNETSVPQGGLECLYSSSDPSRTVGTIVESESIATTEVLMPEGVISWDMEVSGPADIALSYSTPNGDVKTAHASVNVQRGDTESVDLHIAPDQVRSVISGSRHTPNGVRGQDHQR
jgi:hypothetical protein